MLPEVFVTSKEEQAIELAAKLRKEGRITTPGPPFQESRRTEMAGLEAQGVFKFITMAEVPSGVRIFRSRFVDDVKSTTTSAPFEKSRLVIQAYNDHGKKAIFTQSPTIQRVSQRLILSLSMVFLACNIYLRDISQAYTQSATALARRIYALPPKEMGLSSDAVLVVYKPLYGVPEAGTHWYNTYHAHHTGPLRLEQSSYDPCLLFTHGNDKAFGIVGLQTDDTLFLADDTFAEQEQDKLVYAAKGREILSTESLFTFNSAFLS